MRAANDNYDALSQSQPVTDRQRRYAEIVALGTHSHTRAAKMAGYAPASARLSAYHNDKNPAVQSLVEKHREEIAQRHSLSEDWVISNLIALARELIPQLRGLGVRASRQTPWHVPRPQARRTRVELCGRTRSTSARNKGGD